MKKYCVQNKGPLCEILCSICIILIFCFLLFLGILEDDCGHILSHKCLGYIYVVATVQKYEIADFICDGRSRYYCLLPSVVMEFKKTVRMVHVSFLYISLIIILKILLNLQ